MPTTEELEPDEYEEGELPLEVLIFACPDLDQNEDKAREAGARIRGILSDILDSVCDLEDIERALREAEATSARARRARQHLLRALSETDGLVVGVGNAWDVLDLPLEHHHHAGLVLSTAPGSSGSGVWPERDAALIPSAPPTQLRGMPLEHRSD